MEAQALLKQALTALNADPARAAALCRQVLAADAGNGDAVLVLSEALRLQGDLDGARQAAEAQTKARPQWFGAHRQVGLVLADLGHHAAAAEALARAAELNPQHPTLWREAGGQWMKAGQTARAQAAYARHGATPTFEPQLARAAKLLSENKVAAAEETLREHLARQGEDVAALRLLSEAQARADRPAEAEASLRRCLELAPDFGYARHALGQLLIGLGRFDEALAEAQELARREPQNRGALKLLAAAHTNRGEYHEALRLYEKLVGEGVAQPSLWTSYGHVLKTVGRSEEAIGAYRKSIAMAPAYGDPYWGLANLKTFRFSADERAAMERVVAAPATTAESRVSINFALGKAYEDADDAAKAFAHYQAGNRLRRAATGYDADITTRNVSETIALWTRDFISARTGGGAPAPDPIFVLGLPRSGSTLVEQILASHSMVEGTMELPHLAGAATALTRAQGADTFLAALSGASVAELAQFGEHYLAAARTHRALGRRFFVDKMPNNWILVGFIKLILPNAKIVDARRHPLACCVSCYKQHFALGQDFSYDLGDLGRYYADYVRMMAHWDAVFPGAVHRVIHEDLAADPEPHIRALLEFCELPFEEACLRPHENTRAVMTASSEQVRQPIAPKSSREWAKFEPWIEPLKTALGEALEGWRG